MDKFKNMFFGLMAAGALAMSFTSWTAQSYALSTDSPRLALATTTVSESSDRDCADKDMSFWHKHRHRRH